MSLKSLSPQKWGKFLAVIRESLIKGIQVVKSFLNTFKIQLEKSRKESTLIRFVTVIHQKYLWGSLILYVALVWFLIFLLEDT